jgi:hypothetical protein
MARFLANLVRAVLSDAPSLATKTTKKSSPRAQRAPIHRRQIALRAVQLGAFVVFVVFVVK